MEKLNKRIWIAIGVLFVFILGYVSGIFHYGNNLAKVAEENKKLHSQVARQTKKIAELEGIGG